MTTIPAKSLLSSFLLCQAFNGFAASDAATYEKNLIDKDPAIRESSVKGLEALGPMNAAGPVAALLMKDPDPGVREEAARALRAWKNPASLSALLKGAKDPVASIRVLCIEALGESANPIAHKAVLAAAKDAAPEVRQAVMRAFFYADTPDQVSAAAAALRDPDATVRDSAARVIDFYAKLHMPAECKALLADSDPAVRASAARSLIQAGDGEGLSPALELIKSDNQTARLLAIDALGYTQENAQAKAALAQMVSNALDPYAREAAQRSLKRTGRQHS